MGSGSLHAMMTAQRRHEQEEYARWRQADDRHQFWYALNAIAVVCGGLTLLGFAVIGAAVVFASISWGA